MAVKYYLELRIETNLMVSLRIYRDDPRKFGGSASMEAVKMRNFESGELDPAKVRINANFSNSRSNEYGYIPAEVGGIIECLELAKDVAEEFDFWVKTVADFERVALDPWPESHRKSRGDFLNVSDPDGTITIKYSPAFAENVRP